MKLKNKDRENKEMGKAELIDVSRPPAIDFRSSYDQLVELIRDQAMIGKNPDTASMQSLALTRAKAQNFLDAVFNIVQASHLHEIVENDKYKFRRADEMAVMQPMLRSLQVAAISGEKSLRFLTAKLDVALAAMEDPYEVTEEDKRQDNKTMQKHLLQTEMIAAIQAAHTAALENINRIVSGLTRVIQLERFSGARPWGNKASITFSGGEEGGKGNGGDGGGVGGGKEVRKNRQLSPEEIMGSIEKNKKKYSGLEDGYDQEDEEDGE